MTPHTPPGAVYTPPRPNSGLVWEPTATGLRTGGLVLGLTVAWLVAVSWWVHRARGRRPRNSESPAPLSTPPSAAAVAARSVRDALTDRTGRPHDAATADDCAASSDLRAALGPEAHRQVVELLEAADVARFSNRADLETETDWATWAGRLTRQLRETPPDPAAPRPEP